jgi:Cu/Ag efflux pump CusA
LWSDQYESTPHVRQWLMLVALVTLAIILFLLYSRTRSVVKTVIVTPAMAFFAARAIWFLYLLSANAA